ncbi:multidrug ABC transporter permease/ATP-binding protein [Phocicoccus schoeneichii]|uniref:Putative multidrug resistance ABC transporter ATP-binding/permease protein YheI n=2 Tax=Phocicoccus schoeneichii TaxID=1812261 RepID=A0A6V7RPP8_9BACL|nr:ABC transporter ATP-binding protein [Jeotgalicoccus schoeneichii]GGH55528.1 multidrug ABC transporter permease/ATP-binding protein [Jeotgalicoccus schoeneichii]CAD2079596.1 putative multidrug resistance ABC transporter ATP-binding/permease protein YheI [Jeotgalicoccus schoeneichii]
MLNFLKQLKWFFTTHKKTYILLFLTVILLNIIDVVPPYIIGKSIDFITEGSMSKELLMKIVLIFSIIIVISYTLSFVYSFLIWQGAYKVETIVRHRLMRKFLLMSPSFFEKNKTGDLMAKVTNDLKSVSNGVGIGIFTLLDSSAYMITLLITMMVVVSWKLTILAILPLPILIFVEVFIGKKIHLAHEKAQKSFGDMNNSVLEGVEGVRLTRSFVQEKDEYARFYDMTENYLQKFMKVVKLDSLFNPLTTIVVSVTFILSFGFGAYFINRGDITLGEFITFNIYLNMMIWPMFATGITIDLMQRGNASYTRINRVFNTEDDVIFGTNSDHKTDIGFESYGFTYPSSNHVNLKNITIDLKSGDTLGIVGRTGSGKTTLIKQLLMYYPFGEGKLQIDGVPISDISRSDFREKIGYVSQDNILFSKTVRENILFGKQDATEEELQEAIKMSALDQDIENMPNGLDTLVGEKGIALSGGQKQRVSIARSFIKNPDILILDDALSAVDAMTESRIIENIKATRQGKTTIIITHRLSAVQHADQILVLDKGEIVERGTHHELSNSGGWYQKQHEYYLSGGDDDEEL